MLGAVFEQRLDGRPHQKNRLPDNVIDSARLIDLVVLGGTVTTAGVRNNVSAALQYLNQCLLGHGTVGISSLMEDAATAEINRAQLWQWMHN